MQPMATSITLAVPCPVLIIIHHLEIFPTQAIAVHALHSKTMLMMIDIRIVASIVGLARDLPTMAGFLSLLNLHVGKCLGTTMPHRRQFRNCHFLILLISS
jgi:hypothetical protein